MLEQKLKLLVSFVNMVRVAHSEQLHWDISSSFDMISSVAASAANEPSQCLE